MLNRMKKDELTTETPDDAKRVLCLRAYQNLKK